MGNGISSLLADIESFEKHKIVAILLGANNLASLNINKNEIRIRLQKLENKITNIKLISKILHKDKQIKAYKDIYISPLRANGSLQITQFARVVKKILSLDLQIVKKPINAKYFLRGNYEVLRNSIFINLTISDTYNKVLKSINMTLDKEAYKHLKYKVSTKSFDESLNSGFVKSGKLYVEIGFKGYNRANGIDLENGDKVDIVVKTNKPMCYFLVGYVLRDKNKFAYLLEIGSDNQKYINQITGSDVNKNITIAEEVPIEAPFGSETLQIFSSSFGKNSKCSLIPPNCNDNDDGYCVINGKPEKVVSQTRGLNFKKRKRDIEKAENSLSWTSFRR